jgi:hydroxymethylglutaryl-CoA lyase
MKNTKTEKSELKLIECPRDAMQGLADFVPTDIKAKYLNTLLRVGFHTLDFGSFVSPKAIPQMRDTAEVLAQLDLSQTRTKLLAIIANIKGAEMATSFPEIDYLGFPFSISETFQQRNTNSSIAQSLETVSALLSLCDKHQKEAVIYLSMGFGNPYGDEWSPQIVADWLGRLSNMGVKTISLSDTVGVSSPEKITAIYPKHTSIEIGLHLHSTKETSYAKIKAAFNVGCRRIDSTLAGYGGCPMAQNDLVGNLATEDVLQYLSTQQIDTKINTHAWEEALKYSKQIFV